MYQILHNLKKPKATTLKASSCEEVYQMDKEIQNTLLVTRGRDSGTRR